MHPSLHTGMVRAMWLFKYSTPGTLGRYRLVLSSSDNVISSDMWILLSHVTPSLNAPYPNRIIIVKLKSDHMFPSNIH